jgi:oligoribonuclease
LAVLIWMDLEMTGLDPERHVIVEIATLVTDDELNIIAEGPDLVIHQSDEVLAEMDDFVTNMHTTTGLPDQGLHHQFGRRNASDIGLHPTA